MKICTKCKESKELSEFNKKKKNKDGHQNICRECSKKRSRQYYEENREHHKKVIGERNIKIRSENYNKVNEIKSAGCSKCPETDPCCIDFHHVNDDKDIDVSYMVRNGYGWDRIQAEIDKCILVCSNCHRKIHRILK